MNISGEIKRITTNDNFSVITVNVQSADSFGLQLIGYDIDIKLIGQISYVQNLFDHDKFYGEIFEDDANYFVKVK